MTLLYQDNTGERITRESEPKHYDIALSRQYNVAYIISTNSYKYNYGNIYKIRFP